MKEKANWPHGTKGLSCDDRRKRHLNKRDFKWCHHSRASHCMQSVVLRSVAALHTTEVPDPPTEGLERLLRWRLPYILWGVPPSRSPQAHPRGRGRAVAQEHRIRGRRSARGGSRRLFDDAGKPFNETRVDFRYDDSQEDNLKLLLQRVKQEVVRREINVLVRDKKSFDRCLLAAPGLVSAWGGRAAALRARHHQRPGELDRSWRVRRRCPRATWRSLVVLAPVRYNFTLRNCSKWLS